MTNIVSINELERPEALWVMRKLVMPRYAWRLKKNSSVRHVCIGKKCSNGTYAGGHGLCLKVFVYMKGYCHRSLIVPPEILVSHPTYGKVRVETDVDYVGSLVTNDNMVPSPEIYDNGSIACQFKDRHGEKYLLTARHVFTGLEPGDEVTWSKESHIGNGAFTDVLNWDVVVDYGNGEPGFLDAAVVRIHPGEEGIYNIHGDYPHGDAVLAWEEKDDIEGVQICGNSGLIYAVPDGETPTGEHFPGPDGSVPYWRTMRFHYGTVEAPQDGDSGAPVISPVDGTWVGMHLGSETDRNIAYALCSGDIWKFLHERMDGPLQLVP